jgi:putative protease
MELLAPAGNLEKLKWAVAYGADAVYFGTKFGSLRSFAGNFSLDEAAEGLDYLHRRGKKGYVTFNIYPFSHEYDKIIQSVRTLDEIGADAFIVADLGILTTLKRLDLKADLFVSTQANTTSYQTALALKELGAKRVNLARELSFEQILAIQKKTRGEIDTEVFIHGALCFSYSGRCAISDHLTGFSANRGQCKQPCRWKYYLVEETRPGQYMPVCEDDRGLYLFSSKDLALFEFVPALRDAGVHSVKIEGRMKSIHYVASVVALYRQILDGKAFSRQEGMHLLHRVSNRGYTIGFMKGKTNLDDYAGGPNESGASSVFVGNVRECADPGRCVMEVRNKVVQGEQLEILSPGGLISQIKLPEPLTTTEGRYVTSASNPQSIFLDQELVPYTVLRRITER